jgi:nitrate/TMAO reductase-like tetraheme cytochrome c subunit
MIKKIFGRCFGFIKRMSWPKRILLAVILLGLFSFVAVEVTSTPTFCGTCHIMKDYHASWEASAHNEVSCVECHTQPGPANYAKAKIQGLSQTIDDIVGRVGTKPSARVEDVSCLRADCHSIKEVSEAKVKHKGLKFEHSKHLEKTVDGVIMQCGTCHNHYEGQEHFSVNSEVCFTCHFLTGSKGDKRLVETGCRNCHEVPDKVIKKGMIDVNHAEFVSYGASCDESCHKRQIHQKSKVEEYSCVACHDFTKSHDATDSVKLHELHSTGEKVECFQCHGNISHAKSGEADLSRMMGCENCHSDVHNVQGSFYSAAEHPQGQDNAKVLGPMYLTHVECSDCHIVREPLEKGGISSIGTVAKAVGAACDKCHEKGTGEKFIPFWQGQTKKLHAKVSDKVKELQGRIERTVDTAKIEEIKKAVAEANALLDTVASDGSWGVHNLKYTEALLLKANDIVNKVE